MTDLKLFTDEHIHKPVVDQLDNRGIDIVRVEDIDWKGEADQSLLEYAVSEQRMLITGDDDFLRLHAEWKSAGKQHHGIVYILPSVRHLPRDRAISIIFNELWFLAQAVREGAASLEEDVYNSVVFVSGK